MSIESVISGTRLWHCEHADACTFMASLPQDCVDLVFGSPPYPLKGRRYEPGGGIGKPMTVREWVAWMYEVTRQAVRICKGDVCWVINNTVADGKYHPAIEGLLWQWYEAGGELERPALWVKNPVPSTRPWFTNAYESIVVFPSYKENQDRVFNWESIATKPIHDSAGPYRQRQTNGKRPNVPREYTKPELSRPRDVFYVPVGGGHMGNPIASKNEAPYPEALVEPFVKVLTNEDGIVFDCFGGSGTTAAVSVGLGRRFIGCDVRASQVELCNRRMRGTTPPLAYSVA